MKKIKEFFIIFFRIEFVRFLCKITNFFNLNCFHVCSQLRKAIEDVNSGNLTSNQSNQSASTEKPPLQPQEVPLLQSENEKDEKNEKNNQNTVNSMDSALSNSDNCSDVELGNPVEHKMEPKQSL